MFKINNTYNFPNLPVPDKKETLKKFLEWVEPLISEQEYHHACKLVNDYINDPISDKLHEILIERASNKNSSWLIDWWIKYCYLITRGPVTPQNNAPMMFVANHFKDYNRLEIVSLMIYAIVQVYLELKNNNNLINDQQFNQKKHYSLDQLIYLFASMREPYHEFDQYWSFDKISNFVVIMKNNVAYKLPVLDENNQLYSLDRIYSNLKKIANVDLSNDIGFNFISCATDHDEAKKLLEEITINEQNLKSYDDLKSAIIIFCIDDWENETAKLAIKNFINNKTFNRFHGKSLLINIDKLKNVIMCAEHTMVDGGTEIYLMSRISKLFDEFPSINYDDKFNDYMVLDFNLTTSQLVKLESIKKAFDEYCSNTDAIYIESKLLNKVWCKQNNLISTDGLIHLLYQIAQYKTNQEIKNTYVAVDVRNFFKGRTECIRPISNYSKVFVKDFCEGKITSKAELLTALNEIFNIHYARSKACQNGLGINRYIFGLNIAFSEHCERLKLVKPKLFDCEAWKVISENILSTSSILSPNIAWSYFDPVHPDGIGIFYALKDEHFRCSISYWVKDKIYANTFAKNLEWGIKKIYDLINEEVN